MITELVNVIKFCEADEETESTILNQIQEYSESYVKRYCHKDFESTDYSEYYDGNGGKSIFLDNYPITALTRVCVGRRYAIKIYNTSDYTSATVSVNSSGIVLTKDGTSDSTVTFADYTTMNDVVGAINSIGSGWSASIYHSDYNSFDSSELVEMFGKSAIDSNYVYLEMPEEGIDDFEVFPNKGELYRENGWTEGFRNIFVKYTAGHTTMPEEIKLAIMIICKYFYQKRNEESYGAKDYWTGDYRVTFEEGEIPKEAKIILDRNKRYLV